MKNLNNLFEKINANIIAAENGTNETVIIIDDISGNMKALDIDDLEDYINFLESRVREAKKILKDKKYG